MKIISKFKDFYDYKVAKYGVDEKLVYNRKTCCDYYKIRFQYLNLHKNVPEKVSIEDFDNNPADFQSFEKIISHSELKEEVGLFFQEGYDKVKFLKDIDRYIGNAKDLGFLKVVNSKEDTRYQIHRIIKQKITLDILEDFKQKLLGYVGTI